MGFFSLWPYFCLMAAILAAAGTRACAALDPAPGGERGRMATLDGLRGLLALSVFFSHAAIYHGWLAESRWEMPPSRFYALLGLLGVEFFFMITGTLFWSKVIRERGSTDWLRLYVGRVFRLGPVYVLAVAGLVAVIMARSGWQLLEPADAWLRHVGAWLALGALAGTPVNGDPAAWTVLAGVTWTLQYEWAFYASLPWLVVFARSRRSHLAASGIGLVVALWAVHRGGFAGAISPFNASMTVLFGLGMITASLHECGGRVRLPDWLASVLVLALVTMVFVVWPDVLGVPSLLALGAAYYLIASGCTLFGLLLTRAAQRLGHISYGIYLLQGLALTAAFAPAPLRAFALHSAWQFWTVIALAAALLVSAAAMAHLAVERPGIALGRRVANGLFGRPAAGPLRAG